MAPPKLLYVCLDGLGDDAAVPVGGLADELVEGLVADIGGNLLGYGVQSVILPNWFVRRRGIAVAVCASGNYVGGAIWPPVVAVQSGAPVAASNT